MAPTIVNPDTQSGFARDTIALALTATDPENDSLTYSAVGLPLGLSISAASGQISGELTTAGTYTVTVTVTDDNNNSASELFEWVVDAFVPHNVLLIIADDMGVEILERYGEAGDYPPTPNINSLFDQGVFFRNAWAAPICSPTRATMLTGRYGFRTGIGNIVGGTTGSPSLSLDEFTLPEALQTDQESGYASANIGKWHLSPRTEGRDLPNQMGYDHYAGLLAGGLSDYENWLRTEDGVNQTVTTYATTQNVDDGIEWLDQQNASGTPWFLWMAFNAPHSPFHKPSDDTLHSFDYLSGDQADIDANPYPYYKAMVEAMDSEIGRLLDSMPTDVRDNTTIIFIGDNGTPSEVIQAPYDSTQAKGRIYEEGINVPLIIAGPRVANPNRESAALVNSVDIYATVLDLMGVDIAAALPPATTIDSVSMVPYVENSTIGGIDDSNREWAFAERFAPHAPIHDGKTIRDARFKFIRFDSGDEEFYDLDNDKFEDNNLLENPLTVEAELSYCTLYETMITLLSSEAGTTIPTLPTACTTVLATPTPISTPAQTATPMPTVTPTSVPPDGTDQTNLPIGDGNVSTVSPQVGHIYVCNDNFQTPNNNQTTGTWIRDNGTFDYTAKATVDGSVSWPHELTITLQNGNRIFTGNNLPSHTTGTFPINPSDDAYQYDRNPNAIQSQVLTYTLPADPQIAASPSCIRMGSIGVGLTGAVFYNALDVLGNDAVAHEIQDLCQGHPQAIGQYHYHNLSSCLADNNNGGHSNLVGYALDGFGIYGHHDEDGSIITNLDLDECHGHTHQIEWDGENVDMYHYHATYQYPYTIGCFKGTPVDR